MHRSLAVLESEWFAGSGDTVKPFFEGLSQAVSQGSRPDNFYYERFVGQSSLVENMEYLVTRRDVRTLYLASHGSKEAIGCPNDDVVSVGSFALALAGAMSKTRLDGLHLGSCLVGSVRNAGTLLSAHPETRHNVRWVAGYEEEVDWIESTLLDIFFLRHVIDRTLGGDSAAAAMKFACNELLYKVPGLVEHMKFRVWVRQRGTGNIIDLFKRTEQDREQDLIRWVDEQDDDGDETE